ETGSWVESGGVYTITRMATIASTNQHANLQLQTWSDGVTSDRYDIQSGSPAQATGLGWRLPLTRRHVVIR
ncbi:hypothetical protein, partial [Escherichia coli]|uniref:hypothetical protein n=1 Tax=Escherichia coli TaxID=562 RepID=UPI000AF05E39